MNTKHVLQFWFHLFNALTAAIFLIAVQQIEYFKLLSDIKQADIELYVFIKLFLICWVIMNILLSYFKLKKSN